MVSVVVPAHNESAVIATLLASLSTAGSELSVTVVCNGCTDDTAKVAGAVPGVRVIETPTASKQEALRLGNEAADGFPRVYVDADVDISGEDVLLLCRTVTDRGLLAAAPRRALERAGVSLAVRWYYDVWERLPNVRRSLFGRGVVAVSAQGFARLRDQPAVLNDDLAMSVAFSDAERAVVEDARVVIHPPKTWGDLLERRIRIATGTAQLYQSRTPPREEARTQPRDVITLAMRRPWLLPKIAIFLVGAEMTRRRAAEAIANQDYVTWRRDNSSRVR